MQKINTENAPTFGRGKSKKISHFIVYKTRTLKIMSIQLPQLKKYPQCDETTY